MNDNRGKDKGKITSYGLFVILVVLWTALVYVFFFVNFIRDFLGLRGG